MSDLLPVISDYASGMEGTSTVKDCGPFPRELVVL